MNSKKLPKKVTTTLFGVEVSGYKLPNGDWVMGVRDISRMVQKHPNDLSRFLDSKWLKSRLKKIKPLKTLSVSNSPPIKVVPLNIVILFIRRQDQVGNLQASYLMDALLAKSLESRFDEVFAEPSYDVRQIEKKDTPLYCLYIFYDTKTNVTKIGISGDVSRRHQELQNQSGRELQIKYVSKEMSYELARQIECELHEEFDDCRLYGEWFEVNYVVVLNYL